MSQREKIKRHLNKLCKDIGPRPTGSAANEAAVKYACSELKACGLSVERQEFDCIDWHNDGGRLYVDGESIPITPAPYTLPCETEAELVCIQSIDQLRQADLKGKIVVLYGEICIEPLMPKGFMFWNPEKHQEIIALLENGNPCAVLTISLDASELVPMIEDGDFNIPCAILPRSCLPALLTGKTANLILRTARMNTKAANVIATYGEGPEKIALSAHIDTAPQTPGALDNASGVAVLLGLAAALEGSELPYQIEFVLFNGEDHYSNIGEMVYRGSYLAAPASYKYAINVDGAGLQDSLISYSFYECPEDLEKMVAQAAVAYKLEQIDPWPQGDHTLFSLAGVPAIAITSSEIFSLMGSVLHTENDTDERIDLDKLECLVSFLKQVIQNSSR